METSARTEPDVEPVEMTADIEMVRTSADEVKEETAGNEPRVRKERTVPVVVPSLLVAIARVKYRVRGARPESDTDRVTSLVPSADVSGND